MFTIISNEEDHGAGNYHQQKIVLNLLELKKHCLRNQNINPHVHIQQLTKLSNVIQEIKSSFVKIHPTLHEM